MWSVVLCIDPYIYLCVMIPGIVKFYKDTFFPSLCLSLSLSLYFYSQLAIVQYNCSGYRVFVSDIYI